MSQEKSIADTIADVVASQVGDEVTKETAIADILEEKKPETKLSDASDTDNFVMVKSAKKTNKNGGDDVVLWEKDHRHPTGEAFISSPKKPVKVFLTQRVQQLLDEKLLKKVGK